MAWQEVRASDGSIYYYNSETKQSVREKPEELFTKLDRYLYKTDWRQHTAGNGKTYYYHIKTKQSVWDLPQEVQDLMDAEGGTEPSPVAVAVPVREGSEMKKEAEESKEVLVDPKEKYRNTSKLLEKLPIRNDKEAEDQFIEMLREEHVDSTWSFSRVLEFFIKDPRYWVIEDSLQKKQIFESYLNNRTKEELMRENTSVEKFKEAFLDLLKSKPEIKYYTRWITVKKMIQDEPIYAHSVISEKIKKQTFQDYVDTLRKDHDAKEQKLRDQALQELDEYFKTMNLTLYSTWDKTLASIKQDKRFEQNKHFEVLNQLDLITVYENKISSLQKEYKDKIKQQAKINYRADRIARDGFRELLKELKEAGLLRADTTWDEAYPLINEDDRFVAMLGRKGSTPLELFQDAVEEEELLIRAKKAVVEQLLVNQGLEVKDDVDLEEQKQRIVEILAKDPQTQEYDEDSITLIYEKLLKDAKEQKQREREAMERKLRRAQDTFRAFLQGFQDPVITENTKWEDIKSRIESSDEYQTLKDEEVAKAVFEKYTQKIKDDRIAMEHRKEEELKRIIANATNARREINEKKRPLPQEPVDELDY